MSTTVGTVIIDVKADTAKLVSGMDKAEKTVKNSVNNIKRAIVSMAAAYAGIQGVKAFTGMINDSIDAADATGKLAQKLGLTTDALSEYRYAAGFAAVSNGELNAGLGALIRRLNNFQRTGGGAAKTAFLELGISAEYARKHFTDTDTAFKEIIKRLEKMPDGFKKTAIAQDIFSKSASSIMRLTSSDLEKFSKEAQRIGVSISQSTYEMAAAYHDQMDQIDARMKGFKQTISFSMIAPLDAASKTALTFMDAAFGSDATSKIKNFESITVTSISNIVYSLGFIKDVGTGIELVLDGIKLAFYALAGVAAVAMEPVKTMINDMIDSYNYLADKIGQDKIGFKLESSIPDITTKIESIKNEMIELTSNINNGRMSGEKFAIDFRNNLAKVKAAAEETKKSINDIESTPTNSPKDLGGKLGGDADAQVEAYYERLDKATATLKEFFNITATDAEKWQVSLNDKMAKLAADGSLSAEQLGQAFDTLQSDYEINLSINGLDEIQSSFDKIIDSQISLAEGVNNWGNDLTGTAKVIGNLSKTMSTFRVNDLKHEKVQHRLNTTYAGEYLKLEKAKIPEIEKTQKQKELTANFDKDTAQAKDQQFSNEMAGYSNLAGAMASAYEQGSAGAIAFTALQATLGIASSWSAIAQAWNLGFPQSIPAVAMVTAAVLPIIGQLSSMGGSGGGGGSASSISGQQAGDSKFSSSMIELSDQPVLDRLDRQIELLEIIGLEGTASRAKLEQSAYQSKTDIKTLAEEIIMSTQTHAIDTSTQTSEYIKRAWDAQFSKANDVVGKELYTLHSHEERVYDAPEDYEIMGAYRGTTTKYDDISFNADVFRNNVLTSVSAIFEAGLISRLSDWRDAEEDGARTTEEIGQWQNAKGLENLAQFQETAQDYIKTMGDVVDGMADAKDDLKDLYDALNNDFYAKRDFGEAQEQVNKLLASSGMSYSDYVAKEISVIENVQSKFNTNITELFLSSKPEDLLEQSRALDELNKALDGAFGAGVEDALNYMDAIKLVGEAMANSQNNISSFMDSFKTDEQLLQDKAAKVGVKYIASDTTELMKLFESLKRGLGGLTDAELELLEANKELIESEKDLAKTRANNQYSALLGWNNLVEQYNDQENKFEIKSLTDEIKGLTDSIKSMDANLISIDKVVDTLRGNAKGGASLQTFNDAFNELTGYEDKSSKEFSDALKNTINLSKVVSDPSQYTSKESMKFNQLVTANKFESLGGAIRTEIDALDEIIVELREDKTLLEGIDKSLIALTEMDIGGTQSEVFTRGDIIEAIHSVNWDIAVGQTVADAMTDLYDESYTFDTQALQDWMDSSSTLFDFDLDGLPEAVRGINELGQKYIDLDLDSDGILDIRMIEDASGNIMRLDLISQATNDLLEFQKANLGGQTATALMDSDLINSLMLGDMQISVNADFETVMAELEEGIDAKFNWNIEGQEYQDFLATTQNAMFDWNGDDVPDAIKEFTENGYKLTYDLDSDDKADLILEFNNADILTRIMTAEQGVVSSMSGLSDTVRGLTVSLVDALNGIGSIAELENLANIQIDANLTASATAKLNELKALANIDIELQSEISDSEFEILKNAVLESEISTGEYSILRDAVLSSDISSSQYGIIKNAMLETELTKADFDAIRNAKIAIDTDTLESLNIGIDSNVKSILDGVEDIGVTPDFQQEVSSLQDITNALNNLDMSVDVGSLNTSISTLGTTLSTAITGTVEVDFSKHSFNEQHQTNEWLGAVNNNLNNIDNNTGWTLRELLVEQRKNREINEKAEQRIARMQQDILLLRKSQERDEYVQQDILEKVG